MARSKNRNSRPCPPAPLAPSAPLAAGVWQSPAGRQWCPIPAVRLAEATPKKKKEVIEPNGPIAFTDEWGQEWRPGQRLFP